MLDRAARVLSLAQFYKQSTQSEIGAKSTNRPTLPSKQDPHKSAYYRCAHPSVQIFVLLLMPHETCGAPAPYELKSEIC